MLSKSPVEKQTDNNRILGLPYQFNVVKNQSSFYDTHFCRGSISIPCYCAPNYLMKNTQSSKYRKYYKNCDNSVRSDRFITERSYDLPVKDKLYAHIVELELLLPAVTSWLE